MSEKNKPYGFLFLTYYVPEKLKEEGTENKENYLSYNAKLKGKILDCNVYENSEINAYFLDTRKINSANEKSVDLKEIIPEFFRKFQPQANRSFFIFVHGTDFLGHSTNFNYDEKLSEDLSDNLEQTIKLFFFTQTDGDTAYDILSNNKKLKLDNNLLGDYFEKILNPEDFVNENTKFKKEGFYYITKITEDVFDQVCFNYLINNLKKNVYNEGKYWPIIIDLRDKKESKENFLNNKSYDKRIKFLDASIWTRIATSDEEFQKIKQEFQWFRERQVYNSAIGQEFIDYWYKLALIEPLSGGPHSGKIAPNRFHSESEMQKKADELLKELKDFKWDFLLIDDFANRDLRKAEENNSNNLNKNETYLKKRQIIQDIINNSFSQNEVNLIGEFEFAEILIDKWRKDEIKNDKVNVAVDKIHDKIYDVLLLDYLFSNEEIIEKNKPKYGTAIFDLIRNAELSDNKGINDKYWIFPVSVFNSALLAEMTEKGYEYHSEYWVFSRGADPINTPHLFRYMLYNFLNLQRKFIMEDLRALFKFFIDYNKREVKLENITELTKWARDILPVFFDKFGAIYQLSLKNEKELSTFLNEVKNKYSVAVSQEEKCDQTTVKMFDIMDVFYNFLVYAIRPEFNRDLLFKWFMVLDKYREIALSKCEFTEEEEGKINNLFDQIAKAVIKLD